jgi:adenine deaminase
VTQIDAGAIGAAFAVAAGERAPDLVVRNCRLVNVHSGAVEEASVLVAGGLIAGFGPPAGVDAPVVVDADRRFAIPGLLDAHVHVEASLLTPSELARAIVPRGVTTLFADFHEVANVLGKRGIDLMVGGASAPLRMYLQVPTYLADADARSLLDDPRGASLGETGLGRLRRDPQRYFALVERARGARLGVNGHGAGLGRAELGMLAAAGQRDDHEAVSREEAVERIRLGMRVLVREGSTERNLDALVELALRAADARMLLFCTDDKHAGDIRTEGHLDHNLRRAIRRGVDPITAVRMATLNAAEHFGLADRLGAIAPGRFADIVLVDDLDEPRASEVIVAGQVVARDGVALWDRPVSQWPEWASRTVHLPRQVTAADFAVAAPRSQGHRRVRVIRVVEDQVFNHRDEAVLPVRGGFVASSAKHDVAKIALVERHGRSGKVAVAFVRGFGLREGAIGSSVSHDHHNLVIVGVDEADMAACAAELLRRQGGLVVVRHGTVVAGLTLSIGGLMSTAPLDAVADGLATVETAARALGCALRAPFMTLSFVSLPGIPDYGLTEEGLFDVATGRTVEVLL